MNMIITMRQFKEDAKKLIRGVFVVVLQNGGQTYSDGAATAAGRSCSDTCIQRQRDHDINSQQLLLYGYGVVL